MNPGFAVFIASVALGALLAVISCRRTWISHGHGSAVREAAVMALSLAAYAVGCLVFGFGFLAQLGSCAAGGLVIAACWRWVPSVTDYVRGEDR
jgi:hypothetical protein